MSSLEEVRENIKMLDVRPDSPWNMILFQGYHATFVMLCDEIEWLHRRIDDLEDKIQGNWADS